MNLGSSKLNKLQISILERDIKKLYSYLDNLGRLKSAALCGWRKTNYSDWFLNEGDCLWRNASQYKRAVKAGSHEGTAVVFTVFVGRRYS
jgi:hypothetical protein